MAEQKNTDEQPADQNQPGTVVSPAGQTTEPPTTFEFHPDKQSEIPTGLQSSETPPAHSGEAITWTASEFIAHEKAASWYLGLAGAAVLLAAIIYLLTKDVITSGVILFGAFLFGVVAARKPRQLQYQIDDHGISIGVKHFVFEEFRSFSVVPEGAFSSIVLLPLKRFGTLTTIYYSPEDEEKIVNMLSSRLPFDEHKLDPVDNFMRRIRF
jgi:hypothetical protein